mmetsp:Transcript_44786/g.112902  ORF Transcript_44786/g.112902 Transcript_44786/m.112902 type:complete len:659 (+) Transcript_44786:76-2052(+)|eukprot:CAMPEP_0177647348 /NCGR_PEP_ID=MMETSP0447-20121125/10250_1 /TAXON_ID=0 /ORGANISM="Stygamoeba regulata, Strain BSH-02190019" /LENGTH=658 /DNA_ID=CAMNT_0019149923 /DNA_START=76 /DNA_END=2052 /DNA_ORIENTATION=-
MAATETLLGGKLAKEMSVSESSGKLDEKTTRCVPTSHYVPRTTTESSGCSDTTFLGDSIESLQHLEQEVEEGNVEYKLMLVNPSPERLVRLISQLKWRLSEGDGEAIYELGVEDNGYLYGLTDEQMSASLATLTAMAKDLQAEASILTTRHGKHGKVCQVLVRQMRDADKIRNIRVAVCGNVDSGKSTLIGVLTTGELDNGRGRARVNVFVHKHEVECGRTSAVSEQIVGFDTKGNVTNYTFLHGSTWSEIADRSCKILSFFDLAGHEKYLKTTIGGMTGHLPDYCMLLIGANMGVTRMTKEHLGLALALRIPLIVVITKIDMCPEHVYKETVATITRLLKLRGVRKLPFLVKDEDNLATCLKNIENDRFVPMFELSSVTGDGLDLLRKHLNFLTPRIQWSESEDEYGELLIDSNFFVTGVGTVVAGTVTAGIIETGQKMLMGPDGNGRFRMVQIKSIHKRRQPVKSVAPGDSAGLCLKKVKRSMIRKGMVLVHPDARPTASWSFKARIRVLYHSTTIQLKYQPVIQCLTMRQTAEIVAMDREVLRTGDTALVSFRFVYRPEFIKPGMRLVFREGRCKGIGIVDSCYTDKELREETLFPRRLATRATVPSAASTEPSCSSPHAAAAPGPAAPQPSKTIASGAGPSTTNSRQVSAIASR